MLRRAGVYFGKCNAKLCCLTALEVGKFCCHGPKRKTAVVNGGWVTITVVFIRSPKLVSDAP